MLAVLALSALLGLGGAGASRLPAAAAQAAPDAVARAVPAAVAASILNVNDEAHLSLTQESGGEDLLEAGQAKGSLPGHVTADIIVANEVHVSFTIHLHGGSLSGHSNAKIHGSGTYISYVGIMNITRGTGTYRTTHGSGKCYGTLNRETDNSTVQVIAKLQR
jgi:hypothetical protein